MEFPQFVQGYEQTPLPGVSMKYSFDDEPTRRRRRRRSTTPCSAPAASGTRAGRPSRCTGRRRASATSTRTCGSSSTPTRTGPRRTTSPSEHPEKVEELVRVWFAEAGKYDVLPLDDRLPMEILDGRAAVAVRRRGRLHVLPGHVRPARARRAQPARPLVQHPRHRRDRRRRRRGRAASPTAHGSAATACSSRTASSGTSTTSSASRRSSS